MFDMKPDRWMSWMALATTAMAVFAAVTMLYVGKYYSRAILNQGQETSQWVYYQASEEHQVICLRDTEAETGIRDDSKG